MTGCPHEYEVSQQSDLPGHVYFDAKAETILHSYSQDEKPITWRGDPNETMSDWSIVVVTNELETKTYHVHKSVMCFGTRASKFFCRTMTKKKSKGKKTGNSTKVQLNQRDADNFPILLDFIYAQPDQITATGTFISASSSISSTSLTIESGESTRMATTAVDGLDSHNAVSLRFLAKKFEVDFMIMEVNNFIQKDLGLKTGLIYLWSASEYKDERLFESAQRLCAENFEQFDMRAIVKLPIDLFRTVVRSLESFNNDDKKLSLFLSEVVCRYMEKNPHAISAELLLELTDSLVMPYIASEAAIGFTALIKELTATEADKYYKDLAQLSRRCAKCVVREYGWNDFSASAAVDEYLGHTEDGIAQDHQLSRIDSLLFATSLAAALEQAQDDYDAVVIEQSRLEDMVTSLHGIVSQLEKLNSLKDEHMSKQQAAVDMAKKQVLALKGQIGVIKRNQTNATPPRPPMDAPDIVNDLSRAQGTPSRRTPSKADAAIRELVSPSQVHVDHCAKTKQRQELRTKAEMRARSILV